MTPSPQSALLPGIQKVLRLDPRDNAAVVLVPLPAGSSLAVGEDSVTVLEDVPAKHKVALADLLPGERIILYGMTVGEAVHLIARGALLSTSNVRHRAAEYTAEREPASFEQPDASAFTARTFLGYYRDDGQVGTRNYWLVIPLVFCEIRMFFILIEEL